MRISDWSSDVCSSDLRSVTQPSPMASRSSPRSGGLQLYSQRRGVTPLVWLTMRSGCSAWRSLNTVCFIRSVCSAETPLTRRAPMKARVPMRTSLPSTTRSEEHTSELQSLMRISYAVFCLKKKKRDLIIHKYDTIRKRLKNKLIEHINSQRYT